MSTKMNSQTDVSLSFKELLDSYKKMEDIVGRIQEFTVQTTLLSFNSSIEAARAGNAGKGFAVIAKEIKKLSENSAKSNAESAEQLTVIREKVNEVFAVRMADIAYDTIDKIDRNLFERHCDIQAWATFDKVVAAVEKKEEAVTREANLLLKNLVEICEVYYDIFITDLNGVVVSSGVYPGIIGRNLSGKDWFKETMALKKPTVNDMYFFEFIGDYTVGYNCPIIGSDKQMLGILSSRFNWSFIYDIIDKARVSAQGDLLLVNNAGRVIGSKNRNDVFKRTVNDIPAAQRALAGEHYGYEITKDDDGAIQIIGYAHTRGYNAYKGKDWSVIAVERM